MSKWDKLGLVKHASARQTSKITKCQYLWGLSYFVYLLHVVTYLWKLQCYYVILFGYGPGCTKFSEITNRRYLRNRFSDFVDFLHVVICILLDIHWSCKNMLFWVGTVRHRFSANHIVLNSKKLENYIRYQVNYLLPLNLRKISCYFGLCPQKTFGQQWLF